MIRPRALSVLSLLGILGVQAAPAEAQATDWLAWQGCWQGEGAPAGEYLCVVPDGPVGVRLLTVADGAVVGESRVIADGRARPVRTEGCSGSEIAFWSADRQRVFLRSELSCESDVKRQASGVFVITTVGSWMSVQAVTIDGRTATRTVSYTSVDDDVAPAAIRAALRQPVLDRATARSSALLPVDADDVNEAVERVEAAAVQEWLIATGQPFELAGELAPATTGTVSWSALDHAGQYAYDAQPVREVVRVVERPIEIVQVVQQPVYVTHVHEYHYRSCWDPFFAGVVVGLGRSLSVGAGYTSCGRSYLSYFSPWGYDLFGWRIVYVRPIIVAGRGVIQPRRTNRPPHIIYTSRPDRDRYSHDTRTPPRHDDPPRTAEPRGSSTTTRTTQQRERSTESFTASVPATGRPTPRVLTPRSYEPATPAPPRYAEPRAPTTPRTAEPRTATPSRTAGPREPTTVRTIDPRSPTTVRSPTIGRATTSQPSRTAQPRTSTSPRAPASGVISTPRTQREATAPARGVTPSRTTTSPPARTARSRGGGSRD